MRRLAQRALLVLSLVIPEMAVAQERPAAGEGAFFVDEQGTLRFFLTDLEGDFLQATFLGSPGDFARQAPDGRRYMHAEAAAARVRIQPAAGGTLTGEGTFQLSMFVTCPVFDPAGPTFSCFFPGPGTASLNAQGTASSHETQAPFTFSAHVAGFFIGQPEAGGPGFFYGTDRQNDIAIAPAPGPAPEPVPVSPTHLASVPDGTLFAVEASTARTIRIGNIGVGSFSDLALTADGRLYGSLGFGGGGRIVRINPGTAERLDLGPSGYASVPGLDFAPDGVLFGVGASLDDPNYLLVTIDRDSGAASPIGPIGVEFVDAITFTRDGRLFGAGWVRERADNDRAVLVSIDPRTGSGTIVGPIGAEFVAGLEASGDGSLLGSLGGTDPNSGGLMRIDPTTGAGTFIGFTGFSPVSGLTTLP